MKLDFEKMDGLVPAIIQDAESGKVLMLAFVALRVHIFGSYVVVILNFFAASVTEF